MSERALPDVNFREHAEPGSGSVSVPTTYVAKELET